MLVGTSPAGGVGDGGGDGFVVGVVDDDVDDCSEMVVDWGGGCLDFVEGVGGEVGGHCGGKFCDDLGVNGSGDGGLLTVLGSVVFFATKQITRLKY